MGSVSGLPWEGKKESDRGTFLGPFDLRSNGTFETNISFFLLDFFNLLVCTSKLPIYYSKRKLSQSPV